MWITATCFVKRGEANAEKRIRRGDECEGDVSRSDHREIYLGATLADVT